MLKDQIKRWVPRPVIDGLKRSKVAMSIHDAVAPAVKRWMLRKADHDEIYTDDYFEMIEETTGRSAGIMTESIMNRFHPASVIDVGCGTGRLILNFRDRGVKVCGVECAKAALQYCRDRGLDVSDLNLADPEQCAKPLGAFDLAVSMEVGHQLPAEIADQYVGFICAQAETVLFSADSGADDRFPLNPKPPRYWIEKFEQSGFRFDAPLSMELKQEWEKRETAPWFYRYPMIFKRN